MDDTRTKKQSDARGQCQSMGGDLAIVRSEDDNTFIFNLVKSQSTVTYLGAWLGFQRSDPQSNFYWNDGTPLEGRYQNWDDKEPTNSFLTYDENCGAMFGTPGILNREPGKWNDVNCDTNGFFLIDAPVILCQKPL